MPLKLYEADLGSTIRVHDEVRVEGVLTDPSSVTVKVKTPKGEVMVATPARSSVGRYYWDVALTEAGIWATRFESSGNEGAEEVRFVCRRSQFS